MRNAANWRPSKYVHEDGRLRGSTDEHDVAIGSRLLAELNAEAYARLLPRFARGRLLDLGCGKAPLFGEYRRHAGEVICADWPKGLHGNEYVDVACDAGRSLPFRDETFDTVLASDLLEHVYDARGLVGEISRLLRPGGHVIINTPFLYRLHEAPHDYHRFTEFALRRMLEDAGLDCAHIEPCGDASIVVADIVAKCAARWGLVGRFIAVALQSCMLRAWRWRRQRKSSFFPITHFAVGKKREAR